VCVIILYSVGEFKLRLQDAERQREEAVSDAEHRVTQLYEDRMAELTTLQTRMMSVQGQLQDAFQEASMAKQREDSAKTAVAKANAQQIALKTEIEELKSNLQRMKDERDREISDAVSKQSYEATVRRLDNERQYLKSQLASEITHKNELQAALLQCQQQLSDVRTQWTNDVTTLKEINERDTRDAQNLQTRLEQQLSVLEAEVGRLQTANADLKSGYQLMRDQVR
jgi:chromosome segregation ATPase